MPAMAVQPLFDEPFLRAHWGSEFEAFQAGPESAALLARLHAWAGRQQLNERSSETAFIQRFFVETWGYHLQGHAGADTAYTCRPQFEIQCAGQSGGTGFADLALGRFGQNADVIPQVLCEFKDIRSGLDARQLRKQNDRSPVDQCFDYLQSAWQARDRDATVEPAFALVTDMNEFRLYIRRLGKSQCQRFLISGGGADPGLLTDHPAAAFRRFLFWRLFHPDLLLAEHGAPRLDRLLRDQVTREKAIEKTFYREYHDFRQFVFRTLVEANPVFPGTRGKLVRLTQRFLDRCIFILFCEDMGRVLRYPPEMLRDLLIEESQSRFYNPEGSRPWDAMRDLFRAMREGGAFGPHTIDRFNGGLFETDPELDALKIPAKVFCAPGQAGHILEHPRTLLYFSGAYNFGLTSESGERAIGLYTLGRIFEQSITELEIMEAEADGRLSLNRLTKRKCDGVYYTPEWVTRYIVENTVGTRLDDIRAELGFSQLAPADEAAVAEYRAYQNDRRRTAPTASAWLEFLRKYRFRLDRLRIVDPACGSGAFLIQALNRLLDEYRWVVAEQARIEGHPGLFDQDDIIRSILAHNIYGVDINPESVEITKLALWLHTAAPGKPLCALDRNICCGNSLVGADFADFYRQKHTTLFEQADENERERINAFDWQAAFPDVFSHGGFDCVIGNPPYIKLQHFRRTQPDIADYLVEARSPDPTDLVSVVKQIEPTDRNPTSPDPTDLASVVKQVEGSRLPNTTLASTGINPVGGKNRPLYTSTQSGNFDMYLPFIEKGLRLLRPEGRMGYIAPNVWMVNEYGRALRQHIRGNRALDRWLDFKSYQVFDEAITYTALQFFRGSPSDTLTCAFAPDGAIATVDWQTADRIPYNQLPEEDAWVLAPQQEKEMLKKLLAKNPPLSSLAADGAVGFRGIESGADEFFHFDRLGPNRYVGAKNGARMDMRGVEVSIDDSVMRKLISSEDAKRYTRPQTERHTIFPYDIKQSAASLMTEQDLARNHPRCLEWFKQNEQMLRARDNGAMDRSSGWYGYTRPMNLHLQGQAKLGVPQTVQKLHAFFDSQGEYCFNNVRVGGILVTDEEAGWFLLGVLNSPVPDWVFRRIARPKEGGYYEANKQFIAPLPIPDASPEQRADIASHARALQDLHTQRRDTIQKLDRRLNSPQTAEIKPALPPDWLWADIGTPASWKSSPDAPAGLTGRALTAWAKERHAEALQTRCEQLDALLQPGVTLGIESSDDELALHIQGREILRLYDRSDTPFIAAQWRHALRDANVTEAFDAKRLLRILLDLRTTEDAPLRTRILALDHEITALDTTIAAQETALNTQIYRLYRLTPEEIATVEAG
jgi:hypothetical protein